MKVAVIGAGISGLSTAINIQNLIPRAELTVIAAQFSPHTLSDNPAGFWQPYLLKETPYHLQRKWGTTTFKHMWDVFHSTSAKSSGIQMLSSYTLFRNKVPDPNWADIVLGFRHMTEEELKRWPQYSHGWFFTSFAADCPLYTPWLLARYKSNGGKCVEKKLHSLTELCGQYDVIVNSTGLGSRELVGDTSVSPVRGQVLRVKAPWIKFAISSEDLSEYYILPGVETTVLGGTHDEGTYNTTPSDRDRDRIWEGCCSLVPSLRNAEIVKEWVGLRPGRPSVRVAKEDIVHGNITMKVVHNYGHGGAGVTLHWGCARDAAQLVLQCSNELAPSKL